MRQRLRSRSSCSSVGRHNSLVRMRTRWATTAKTQLRLLLPLVAELRRALRKARSLRRTPRSFFYSRGLKHPTDFVVNGCQIRFTPQTKTASAKEKRVTTFLL